MRSEEEIRRLLRRLEERLKRCEINKITICDIKIDDTIVVSDCCERGGIGEWIRALRWVLGEKVDPY